MYRYVSIFEMVTNVNKEFAVARVQLLKYFTHLMKKLKFGINMKKEYDQIYVLFNKKIDLKIN